MTSIGDHRMAPGKVGLVLHKAAFYDFGVWLMLLGRERAFREEMLRPARLARSESVLDVGCGTGGLALAAKRQVGAEGRVTGVDPSLEMLARAEKKARKAGLDIVFKQAAAQALPFVDAQFDVVCSTLMLHHLPRQARGEFAREARRVLRPGGRVLAIDFAAPEAGRHRVLPGLHRHGHVKPGHIAAILEEAGLKVVDSGVTTRGLQFALATKLDAG